MLEKFHDDLLTNDDIVLLDENFSKVKFFGNEIGILGVDLDKISLDEDNNFYKGDPETTIHVRTLA